MLPAVLEIYLVWHPGEGVEARSAAESVIQHFHGDTFSGLIGGAVEVYIRSEGWADNKGAPRAIPLPGTGAHPAPAAFVAVVPLVGNETARALRDDAQWNEYLRGLVEAEQRDGAHVRVLPVQLQRNARMPDYLAKYQLLAAEDPAAQEEDILSRLRRDLTQALTQFLAASAAPIQIFVSHTKRAGSSSGTETHDLIGQVREVVRNTRLGEFFDANSIQPGEDWAEYLVCNARTGAMLALRSDLYASRNWCHREVMEAKTADVPVVVLDALRDCERRGSFLLDHVPRMPARRANGAWVASSIRRALGLLVDECLKRELWKQQKALAEAAGKDLGISWWAPHAPEPLTLAHWLAEEKTKSNVPNEVLILHPDPPLTWTELGALRRMADLSGISRLEVLTPRTLAARGGS